jgi:hypothetical protein
MVGDYFVKAMNGSILKFGSKENLRSALFDINDMSVYLFDKNRRVIATDNMRKGPADAIHICRTWILEGIYNENDFAA